MKRNQDINLVRQYIEAERYEFYRHALTEAKKDGIEPEDVVYVLLTGKVIEEYPERGRLLIYGTMVNKLPLHVVCDLSDEDVMYIPTVYIPSKEAWIRYQIRKKPSDKKR
jgi:hypothetical protein